MRRPDGLLNHNLLGEDKGPQDACGVFGVWAPGEEVAKLSFYGLYALQHRGTESAGIATSDGERILIFKDMGLVSQVFTEGDLATLKGNLAIGHCRYSTTGSSTWVNAQPTLRPTKYGTLALAHNGNLTNTGDLAELVQKLEGSATSKSGATTDTEIMTALIALQDEKNVEASALAVLPQLEGAFSLVFMDEHTLYAARDRHGVRPLVLGKLETGWVVASEVLLWTLLVLLLFVKSNLENSLQLIAMVCDHNDGQRHNPRAVYLNMFILHALTQQLRVVVFTKHVLQSVRNSQEKHQQRPILSSQYLNQEHQLQLVTQKSLGFLLVWVL